MKENMEEIMRTFVQRNQDRKAPKEVYALESDEGIVLAYETEMEVKINDEV